MFKGEYGKEKELEMREKKKIKTSKRKGVRGKFLTKE
jgi:hypothetical protein